MRTLEGNFCPFAFKQPLAPLQVCAAAEQGVVGHQGAKSVTQVRKQHRAAVHKSVPRRAQLLCGAQVLPFGRSAVLLQSCHLARSTLWVTIFTLPESGVILSGALDAFRVDVRDAGGNSPEGPRGAVSSCVLRCAFGQKLSSVNWSSAKTPWSPGAARACSSTLCRRPPRSTSSSRRTCSRSCDSRPSARSCRRSPPRLRCPRMRAVGLS